jgi:ligand-binding SRPBCC domain-containing protein
MSGRIHVLERRALLPVTVEEAFRFFADAANLERITPAELRFRITTPLPIAMMDGARIDYQLALFRIPFRWKTEITHWEPNKSFVDEQQSGPFRLWRHTHTFESSLGGTWMTDHVRYALPLSPAGELAHPIVRRQLDRIFNYRAEATPSELERYLDDQD